MEQPGPIATVAATEGTAPAVPPTGAAASSALPASSAPSAPSPSPTPTSTTAPRPGQPRAGELDPDAVMKSLEIVLQPIVDLATGSVFALEALARFNRASTIPVDRVFAQAHEKGFGYALEAACLKAALLRRADVPAGVKLSVNVSPDVMHHPAVSKCWDDDMNGVIVEVSERKASNLPALRDQIAWLRVRGAEIAVDDLSSGYTGLLRLASMRPDYLKIERSVVSGVRDSAAQSAVLEALVTLAHRIGASVIGEGIETIEDLTALAGFDVDFGQGFGIGRPGPIVGPINKRVVAACQHSRAQAQQRGSHAATGLRAMSSALSSARYVAELHVAVARAAAELGVDVVGVSVCGQDTMLREITSSGDAIDPRAYPLAEYPATRNAMETGNTVEVHADDPHADVAEKLVLEDLQLASLLVIPLTVGNEAVGVVELAHRTHRRWSNTDISRGRSLAAHLGNAMLRIKDSSAAPAR